jgi:hypothetical protein
MCTRIHLRSFLPVSTALVSDSTCKFLYSAGCPEVHLHLMVTRWPVLLGDRNTGKRTHQEQLNFIMIMMPHGRGGVEVSYTVFVPIHSPLTLSLRATETIG